MPVWNTTAVAEQPDLTMDAWRVLEVPGGAQHLVGFCLERCEGRVSTALVRLDPEQRVAVSASGRSYRLVGKPGFNKDADYVWQRWAAVNGIKSWTDVSTPLWELLRARYQSSSAKH